MPFESDKQRRFMYGVASGSIKKKGISKETAKKFIHDSIKKGVKKHKKK